jgi:hypothetical protein
MTIDDKFICRADANQKLPFNATSAEITAAHREKDRRNKLLKEYIQQRPRMARSLDEDVLAGRMKQARPAPAATTPEAEVIRTSLDDQLPALRRALQPALKLAVGAESRSVSLTDFRDCLRDDAPESQPDSFAQLREIFAYESKSEPEPETDSGFVYFPQRSPDHE